MKIQIIGYSSIATRRFAESDLTVFLDFNRVLCFFSAWRRYLQYRGRARESCPCTEKFDRAFRRRLLFDGRTREKAEKLRRLLAGTAGAQVVLKNRRQVRKFLEKQKAAVGGREV
jgi:hypothetical protein